MSEEFDTRKAFNELRALLEKYDNEHLDLYHEDTYIADIIWFVGKSIDKEKYGHDARTFTNFLAERVYPIANAARTSVKKRFARELGMRT